MGDDLFATYKHFTVNGPIHRPGRKTPTFGVVGKSDELLGLIEWYSPWRLFVFRSEPGIVWSDGCLTDLCAALDAVKAKGAGNV